MPAYVYVSNAEDGDIGMYSLRPDGKLAAELRFEAAPAVMPMTVSPDRKLLLAACRSKPFSALAFEIDAGTGSLKRTGSAPLADSLPYITFDRSGRYMLGASYGGNLVSVNPLRRDGRLEGPRQVIPTARNAHSIVIDRTNKYVFVPHLGTDQVFQFLFDEMTGWLMANTPPVLQLAQGSGPRHLVLSPDNRFAYLLNELSATVTTLALDAKTGLLSEVASASALPPDSKLVPGTPRTGSGPPRNRDNDIWAADIHVTPDGRFVYASERTSSTIATLAADPASGRLTWIGSTPVEKQPRGFRIDPSGKFMVVSGEKSDTIGSYAIDPSTGALERVASAPTGKGSNWVEIVRF